MITRTICGLALGFMVFAMAEAGSGQSGDTNGSASSAGQVQAVQNVADSNAPVAAPAPVPASPDTNVAAPAPVAANPDTNAVAGTPAPANVDTNAAASAAEGTAPQIMTDPMDSVRETMYGAAESRSQHAARINRNIFVVSSIILTLFIICRLALLWKITQNRKKLGRDNSFDN